MPIGEVIADRKITPDQLAFRDRGGSGQASTSYQTELKEYNTTVINNITINEATELVRGEVKHRTEAERRAKSYVGDYHTLFDFDIDDDVVVTTGTWDPIGFHHRVIGHPGANAVGTTGTSNAALAYTCVDKDAGVHMAGCHIEFSFPSASTVTWIKLGVMIDNLLYRVIDAIDIGYPSDGVGYITDCILGGVVPVPLAHNQTLTFAIYAYNGGSGDIALDHSLGECEGYAWAHRVLCHRDAVADTAESGFAYTFT